MTSAPESRKNGRRPARATRLALVAALLLATSACGTKAVVQTGIGETPPMNVRSVVRRGDYLDVWVEGGDVLIRTFAKVGGPCDVVLQPGRQVAYSARGAGGRFTQGDLRCDASGVGDPFVTRVRQPRGSASPITRAQATFSAIYSDEDVILMRGRFPLTGHVGWVGGGDTIAVVRNDALCREVAAEGVASMEYRPAGKNTLALLGAQGLCRIDGLIIP